MKRRQANTVNVTASPPAKRQKRSNASPKQIVTASAEQEIATKDYQKISKATFVAPPPSPIRRRVSSRLKAEPKSDDQTHLIKVDNDRMEETKPAAVPSSTETSPRTPRAIVSKARSHSSRRRSSSPRTAAKRSSRRPTKASPSTPTKPLRPSKATPRRPAKRKASQSRISSQAKKNCKSLVAATGYLMGDCIPQQPPVGADMTITEWVHKNVKKSPPTLFSLESPPLMPLLDSDPQDMSGSIPSLQQRYSPTELKTDSKKCLGKAATAGTLLDSSDLSVSAPTSGLVPIPQVEANHTIQPRMVDANENHKDVNDLQSQFNDFFESGDKVSFETKSFYSVDDIDIFGHSKIIPTPLVKHEPQGSHTGGSAVESASGLSNIQDGMTKGKAGHSKNLELLKASLIKKECTTQDQAVIPESSTQFPVPIDSTPLANESNSFLGIVDVNQFDSGHPMTDPQGRLVVDDAFFLKQEILDRCPFPPRTSNTSGDDKGEVATYIPAGQSDLSLKLPSSSSHSVVRRKFRKKLERRASPQSVMADLSPSELTDMIKIPSRPEMDNMVEGPYLDVDDDPLPIDCTYIPLLEYDVGAINKHRPGHPSKVDLKESSRLSLGLLPEVITKDTCKDDDVPCLAANLFELRDIPTLPYGVKLGKKAMTTSQCLKALDCFLIEIEQKKSQVKLMAEQVGIDLTPDTQDPVASSMADSNEEEEHEQEQRNKLTGTS